MQNNVNNTEAWKNLLNEAADPEKIKILSSFFKTGKGEYREGDVFIGLTVPANRAISKKFFDVPFLTIEEMLNSPIHEFRLAALLALVERYHRHREPKERKAILDFYLANVTHINNWDLVDLSAPQIVGQYVADNNDIALLLHLSRSDKMWTQRIAIVATYTLIKLKQLDCTYEIADRYMVHPHPLIHKATGWMLREAGKRDPERLISYIESRKEVMPRTTLRYAIERFDRTTRDRLMQR